MAGVTENGNSAGSTFVGSLAPLLWSTTAMMTCQIKHLPPFQILSCITGLGFLVAAVRLTMTGQWGKVKQPKRLWAVGIVLMMGNIVGYQLAFKYAPPEQAELIVFLWPIFVVVFSGFLPNESFSVPPLIGAFLAFLGVYLLLEGSEDLTRFNSLYWIGYIASLTAGISWAFYTLFSRYCSEKPPEMVGLYFGWVFVMSLAVHFLYEKTVPMTGTDCFYLGMIGVGIIGVSNIFWNMGVRGGNIRFLSILSYSTPVVGVVWLVASGHVQPSETLAAACLLVFLGSVVDPSYHWWKGRRA